MFKKQSSYSPQEVISTLTEASKANTFTECSFSELDYELRIEQGALGLFVKFPDDNEYRCTDLATSQLCRELAIPLGYYNKISNSLRYQNLSARSQIEKARRFEINTEFGILRGIVPKPYTRISNVDILKVLENSNLPITPLQTFSSKSDIISNQYASFRVLIKELNSGSDVSKNSLAITVRVSELGGFFSVLPVIYREVCTNGLSLWTGTTEDPFRLSYRSIDKSIAQGLIATLVSDIKGKAGKYGSVINDLMKVELKKDQIDEFLQSVLEQKISKGFLAGVKDYLEECNITTSNAWDLTNIITERAQGLTEDSQIKVENALGAVNNLYKIYPDN